MRENALEFFNDSSEAYFTLFEMRLNNLRAQVIDLRTENCKLNRAPVGMDNNYEIHYEEVQYENQKPDWRYEDKESDGWKK